MSRRAPHKRRSAVRDFFRARAAEALAILLLLGMGALSLALISHAMDDPSGNTTTLNAPTNWLGARGAWIADWGLQIFGGSIWALLILVGYAGYTRLRDGAWVTRWYIFFGALIICSFACASALHPWAGSTSGPRAGGAIGQLLAAPLREYVSHWLARAALALFLAMSAFIGFAALLNFRMVHLHAGFAAGQKLWTQARRLREIRFPARRTATPAPRRHASATSATVTTAHPKRKASRRAVREAQPSFIFDPKKGYTLPALHYLAPPRGAARGRISADGLESNARLLETVLSDFGINGTIGTVRPGPVVTLYELEPAAGIRAARIVGLADDIARAMSAIACRVAPVPGSNVIGIELPNAARETVYLRELLSNSQFEASKSRLTLAIGKDIAGAPVFTDLAKMPHLLVAGTTGSGKSVGINTMILSLLYRLSPQQCRLIMIDPKMLELSVYDDIPHLLAPVVTEPKKAVTALKWVVQEMENRYRKMSKINVRSIDGYNTRMEEARAKRETLTREVQTGFDTESGAAQYEYEEIAPEKLPFIVVVIDEMADLMLVAGKEIEAAVQRLAQMARAAGIHLITATQRPSVDVITGTIKANFPSRISFQVTSKIDSRTVLGEQGGEQLLGQGDMLFRGNGGRLHRVHGAFVADEEVERVVTHLKKQGRPEYIEAVTEEPEESAVAEDGAASLYDQAVMIVTRDRRASTSYLQRRLKIGYNRAASLIEDMEAQGVISPPNHAGKRDVLAGKQ